jgi:hypothetical protein
MSIPSVSILSKILQVAETTYNQLPASPTMTQVPIVDFSIAADITNVTDNTIQGDTMHRYVIPTTKKVAGTISGEFAHTNMDWILQGMFYNSYTANVLTTGVTQKSFSIEHGVPDNNVYFLYTGCVVDKLALTLSPQATVTYKADFIGSGFTNTTVTNATTTSNAAIASPMNSVASTIKEGGNVVAYIMGATFSFDRKHSVNYAMGNAFPVSLSTSFFDVTGTIDVYLEDAVMYSKFALGTTSSLDFTLQDSAGNSYELIFPSVRYTSASKDVKGTGPVELKMNFTAVYDPSTATNAKIVRSGP